MTRTAEHPPAPPGDSCPPAAAGTPLFTVRGLTKSYGGRRVLEGLDFEVRRGECLAIVGRSGSGKSVTLRQLNGLEKPDSGSIVFDGTEITTLSERQLFPLRRRIAMLFQDGALFDSMTVFDNVAFPLREHSSLTPSEIAAKVHEKLELVHLPEAGDKMPADLSGGMRKRAALARSLALEPEMMLYDEPTTGLDPITAATIGRLIHRVQQSLCGTSVVITHDLALTRRLADRMAFLSEGRFHFIGGWEEAQRSDDPALQDFLASREEEDDGRT